MSLAEKLQWLLEHVRPDEDDPPPEDGEAPRRRGGQYTQAEIAVFVAKYTGERCHRAYISALVQGTKTNPTVRVLEALAAFFDVNPAYFVDEERAQEIQAQLNLAVALRDDGVRALALRQVTIALANGAGTLSVEDLHAVYALISDLTGRHVSAAVDSSTPAVLDVSAPTNRHQSE